MHYFFIAYSAPTAFAEFRIKEDVPEQDDKWKDLERVWLEVEEDVQGSFWVVVLEEAGEPATVVDYEAQVAESEPFGKYLVSWLEVFCKQVGVFLLLCLENQEQLSHDVVHVVQNQKAHRVHQDVHGIVGAGGHGRV